MLFPSPLNKLYSAVSLFVVLTILLAACQGQPFVTEVFETETPVTANTTQEPSATETATVEANEEVASPTPINVDEVPPPWERYSIPSVRVLPLENLWDRIAKADGLVVIGLKDDFARGYFQGKVLVKPSQVEKLKEVLYTETPGLHRPPDNLQFIPPLASGLIPPWVTARLDSMDTLQNVLNLAFVEFVEPAFFLMDSLACTQDPYTTTRGSANLSDSLGDIINYNFPILGINTAWNRAYPIEPGLSMGIAVIDSGASTEQDQLNDRFALFGNATIRPIATHLTATGITPGDQCGHGTRIAGLASAPRDGKNIVGVAWAAPLTTIKITNNPIVFGGPSHMGNVLAICDAISKASSGGSRVISMAFGMDYTSPTIETCIELTP